MKTYSIDELCGMAWHNAISDTITVMCRVIHDRSLNFRNNWKEAEQYAQTNGLRFDIDGNLI